MVLPAHAMSLNRYNAKRDTAESAILDALGKAGCRWVALDIFDLLVLRAGKLYALEVKTPSSEKRLTDRQRIMMDAGWPIHVVSTPEEALKAVGLL